MRVLHLDLGNSMRGGQWQALRLIEGLNAAGVESTLLTPAGSPLFERARAAGCRVEASSLARVALASRRHDLVHAHDARGHTLGLLAACPLIVSRRVAFPVRSRFKYRRPARFLAISEFVKRVLMDGGVAAEKISVVYDGVPLLGVSRGEPLAGRQGACGAAAGFENRATRPHSVAGEIVAPMGKCGEIGREAARMAGVTIEESVNFEADLARAGLCVYVSESEGLGSGALMAMSAGVPVIASRVGGLTEVVRHGETGWLVENRAESFAAAIREFTNNRGLAQQMGAAARRTVEEKFTVEGMVRRTIEIYAEVLR